ncbi:MAG: hypothetical protein Kow00128_12020 [Deltaproteobacteria bacterium]
MRKFTGAIPILCILLPGSAAFAARLDVTPTLALEQAYDSNAFNTETDEKEDFFLRVTPGLLFSIRMPETTLNLRASLTSDTYYKYSELDSSTSAIGLSLDAEPPIALSPRFSIAPSGHYVEAEDSFRRTQALPSGDPLAPPSISTETGVRKSRDYGGALRIVYLVTPNTEFSASGGFSRRDYLDNTTSEVDSRTYSGETSLSYRFTPLFSSGIFANTSYNRFENGRDSRIYTGGLTASYRFSANTTGTARAGASRVQENDPLAPERVTWSPYGALSLTYTSGGFQGSMGGTFQQSGGGSFGATTERLTASARLSHQFAPRWGWDLAGTYQTSRSLDPTASEDLESANGNAGIRYQPWRWATFRLSGTAYRQWSHGTVGTDLTRYSGLLGVTLGYTYNLY